MIVSKSKLKKGRISNISNQWEFNGSDIEPPVLDEYGMQL